MKHAPFKGRVREVYDCIYAHTYGKLRIAHVQDELLFSLWNGTKLTRARVTYADILHANSLKLLAEYLTEELMRK